MERDGVATELFTYILRMQKTMRSLTQLQGSEGLETRPLQLPVVETVVYQNNFPQSWFQFDQKELQLTKLAGSHLDHEEIFAKFSSVEPLCGNICAQFVGMPDTQHSSSLENETSNHDIPVGNVTYFTPDSLWEWLRSPNKNGLLQKFIPPRGPNNDVLLFVWTPTVTTLIRKTNRHPIDSRRVPMPDKCFTYEGPPHLVDETPGNELLRERLQKCVSKFATMMLKSEHKTVSRFVGCFKHGRDGVLYMLHATSIRVAHEAPIGTTIVRDPVELEPSATHIPTTVPSAYIEQVLAAGESASNMNKYAIFDAAVPRRTVIASHLGGARSRHRRDTQLVLSQSERWTSQNAINIVSNPQELQALRGFIDEVLYCLYSIKVAQQHAGNSRQAVDGGAVITLPNRIAKYLGEERSAELMSGILHLESVRPHELGDDADQEDACYRPSANIFSKLPPQPLLRFKCDEFIHSLA